MVRGSDKVSAIFAKAAGQETWVKQLPCLVKVIPALRAWQATYSWPFSMICAGKGGWPLILMVMSPLGVQNVKGIVVDIGHRLLFLDVVIGADIPHRRLGPADQDEKQSLCDGGPGEIVFRDVVLAFPRRTVDKRNVIRLGIAANAPPKTASQPHHMSVVQRGVRSSELPPPQPETACVMSHPEIRVQYDAINAVIAAAQEIVIKSAQPVAHEGHGRYSGVLTSSCPEGAPFSQQRLRKSVAPYSRRRSRSCCRRGG